METTTQSSQDEARDPPSYVAPTLTYVGSVSEVVQAGGGKLSVNAPDGPDVRKPPGK